MLKNYWKKYKKEIIEFVILLVVAVIITKAFQTVSPVYARYAPRMIFGGIVDILVFLLIKRTFFRREKKKVRIIASLLYFIPEIFLIAILFIITFIIPLHEWEASFRGMVTGLCLVLFYCKIVMFFTILLGFVHVWIGKYFSFFRKGKNILRTYVKIGVILACILFLIYLISIPIGQYKLEVNQIQVPIQNLPESFNEYKIVQLSDLHFGSLYSKERFTYIVDKVNAMNPDLICITGDIVIHNSEEVIPFIPIIKQLKAKDGIFAVLGNHDYMAYSYFKGEKPGDHQPLVDLLTDEAGWKFLNNEVEIIQREKDSLIIAGVENISLNPYFESRGDIPGTLSGIENDKAVILLLHDPSVWSSNVVSEYEFVSLTLSGHTHGLQYFIPSEKVLNFVDKTTKSERIGLYRKGNQYLYINSGIGTTMFRGRLGAWMEITEINLTGDKH